MRNLIEVLFGGKKKNTVNCITVLGCERDIGKNLLSVKQKKDDTPFIAKYFSNLKGLNTFERIQFSNRVSRIMNSRIECAQSQGYYLEH